jgi:hypothetical protein
MAVNEKIVYATQHTTYGGKLYRPGEQLTGRMSDTTIRHAQESGLTTDSHAGAERARGAETERRARVEQEIGSRSEKRDADKQHGQRVVQMPDGSFRLAD